MINGLTWMMQFKWAPRVWVICGRTFLVGVGFLAMVSPAVAVPIFGRPSPYQVDGAPVAVGSLEFDGGIGLDIATANTTGVDGPSFSFLRNRGAGSFFPEARMNLGGVSVQTAVMADFNSDGLGDIALAVDDISFPVRGLVLVYLNQGQGVFAEPAEYALPGLFPRCIEVGDVDGDSALDLVVCHSRSIDGSFEGRVTVLLGEVEQGTPTGAFQVATSSTFASEPASADIGRVDADPRADIVVGDPVDASVAVLYGTGSGFSSAQVVASIESVSAVAVVPRMGAAAEIAATDRLRGRLVILEQTEDRVFEQLEEHQVFLPSALRVADFDEDGDVDIAVASTLGGELWLGSSTGRFTRGELIFVASFGQLSTIDLVTGDFDGNGQSDVAVSSSEDDVVTVVLNGADAPPTPNGGAGTPTPTPIVMTTPLGPGDANCDGRIDAADFAGVTKRIFSAGCEGADVNGDGGVTAADLTALSVDLQS